jgi:hypothetical protein
MIPTIPNNDRKKLTELVNQAPGNYFGLKASNGFKIRTAYYKGKREDFCTRLNDWLSSDLAGDGIYQVVNGSNKVTEPIFLISKGNQSGNAAPIIIQEKGNSDINLVKENAELKAKLHYLELQMAELQEQLSESEEALSEAPDPQEKPNPWFTLAEQLAPAVGSIVAAIASKYINGEPKPTGAVQPQPMAVRYIRPNAQFNPGNLPGQRPDSSGNLQGNDYSRSDVRNQHTEAEN